MPYLRHWGISLCALGVAFAVGACSDDRVLGEQCPSPYTGNASYAPLPDGGPVREALAFGTQCAPCDDGEPDLDEDGCPIYVTFASCGGGDICIGGQVITFNQADAAVADDDAGTDADDGGVESGADESDGGEDG